MNAKAGASVEETANVFARVDAALAAGDRLSAIMRASARQPLPSADSGPLDGGPIALHDAEVRDNLAEASHLHAPHTGTIGRILVATGDHVVRDQRLAELTYFDAPDTDDVERARSAVGRAISDQDAAMASGVAADNEAAGDAYDHAFEALQATRKAAAGGRTTKGYVTAPMDGDVLERDVNPGIAVTAEGESQVAVDLFVIGSRAHVVVVALASDSEAKAISPGDAARFEASAYPGEGFHGTVDSTGSTVFCRVENDGERRLGPGMHGTLWITPGAPGATAR